MIKSISEIRGKNVQWYVVGRRIREVRLSKGLDEITASAEIGCSIESLERGDMRKCVNNIFRVSQGWDLSLNWLLNGIGKMHDADPIELIPETLIVQKGAGIRKTTLKVNADEGSFSEAVMEFVMAVDKYMRVNEIPFPTKTQLFELVLALGYRKCVPARIAPLGYNLELQKKSERSNQEIEVSPVPESKKQEPEPKEIKFEGGWPTNKGPKEKALELQKTPDKLSRSFVLTDPHGKSYITNDLLKFCTDNGLNAASMYKLACPSDINSHQEWRAALVYTKIHKTTRRRRTSSK